MKITTTVDLATLWGAARRVLEQGGTVDVATDESVQREWDAVDVELTRLGIPTRDRRGPSGPGRAWWTAQTETGRIVGIWAECFEEAVIELGVHFRSPIVWCVADTGLTVRNRYPQTKYGEPCISRVTSEPIPGPLFADPEPLF